MGLFKNYNQRTVKKMIRKGIASGTVQRKMVSCPRCGKRYTVTFLGPNDSKTCSCGYKIYND